MSTNCARCGHSSDVHSHDDVNDDHLITDPDCPFRCQECTCSDFVRPKRHPNLGERWTHRETGVVLYIHGVGPRYAHGWIEKDGRRIESKSVALDDLEHDWTPPA